MTLAPLTLVERPRYQDLCEVNWTNVAFNIHLLRSQTTSLRYALTICFAISV